MVHCLFRATTEKSTNLGYNDLVCKVYTLSDTLGDIQSEENYKYSGFLNYAQMNSEGIEHSGDNLEKRFEIQFFNMVFIYQMKKIRK